MIVTQFINAEVQLYDPTCRDRLATAAARAITYEQYVDEIFRRYSDAGPKFRDAFRRMHQTEGMPDLREASHQRMLVHLEIESFYVFTKIQLDGIAQLLHWWVEDSRDDAGKQLMRGLSIKKHSALATQLGSLIASGALAVPDGLLGLAQFLQREVVEYRDWKITHDQTHAFPGTLISRDGDITITKVRSGTDPTTGQQPRPIGELNAFRIHYAAAAMEFLALNRHKGKLCKMLKPS